MTPSSPAANSKNVPDNTYADTVSDSLTSPEASTTGSGHFAKINNAYGSRTANQGTSVSGGQASSTSSNFSQVQNKAGSADGGLGGGKTRGGHS